MSRRWLLQALERAALEADPAVVDRVLADAGGLTRWRARRRAACLLDGSRAAAAASGDAEGDPVGARVQVLQLAWLAAAGRPWRALADDRVATAAAFYAGTGRAAARAPDGDVDALEPRPSRRHRGLLWGLVALALVATGVVWFATRPAPPLTEGPIGRALTADLTDWVVLLDRWAPFGHHERQGAAAEQARASLDAARARVFTPEATDALGPIVSARLAELFDATLALAGEPDVPAALPAREATFRASLRAANAAFAAAALPYFVDGDWQVHDEGYAQTTLFIFGVLARHRVRAASAGGPGEQLVWAVHLHRLDTLNWSWSKLGYTRKSMDVAAVLLDRVEEQLITYVGPALAEGAAMPLVEPDDRDAALAWQDAAQRAAGAVARAAFARALPGEEARLRALGQALEERRAHFGRWRARLAQDGYVLRVPGTLALDDELYAALKAALPDYQVDQLEDVQREVESADNRAVFARMLERHARSVEVHEVQHRLDYARGDAFPVPEAVRRRVGPSGDDTLAERRVERVTYELSAYTSEIAREPDWARLDLTFLVRHALSRRGAAVEAAVAVLLLDGLAEELGLSARIGDTGAVRRHAAEVYLALLEVDEDRLAAAAGALWSRWFAAPLATVERLAADAP